MERVRAVPQLAVAGRPLALAPSTALHRLQPGGEPLW